MGSWREKEIFYSFSLLKNSLHFCVSPDELRSEQCCFSSVGVKKLQKFVRHFPGFCYKYIRATSYFSENSRNILLRQKVSFSFELIEKSHLA